MTTDSFRVAAPATIANVGPGFDAVGLALALVNEVEVTPVAAGFDEFHGSGQARGLSVGPDNQFFAGLDAAVEELGVTRPRVRVHCCASVPIGRGLGSSAAAIVMGILAGYRLSGHAPDRQRISSIAAHLDGHADNVSAAIYGGLTSATLDRGRVLVVRQRVHPNWEFVLAVPPTKVATSQSRRSLPAAVTLSQAAFNLARVPLLLDTLVMGRPQHLVAATRDALHQLARAVHIPDYQALSDAAATVEQAAVVIAGSGPTLAALCWGRVAAREVETRWRRISHQRQHALQLVRIRPTPVGARVY